MVLNIGGIHNCCCGCVRRNAPVAHASGRMYLLRMRQEECTCCACVRKNVLVAHASGGIICCACVRWNVPVAHASGRI